MNRPFVFVNMAMTADGKITSAGRDYPRFMSRIDRDNMDRLRAQADGILVGAGTMRADNPKLWVRSAEMQEYRRSLGRDRGLLKIVVTASVNLPRDADFFADADNGGRVIATTERADEERLAHLPGDIDIWRLGREHVDLPRLLSRLRDERGIERLLVEGGGELNWNFVRQDLFDEIFVTIAPALLGGRAAPTLLEGEGFSMADQRRLKLLDLRQVEDEIYCRYGVIRTDQV